jgi:hypothetical protein
MPNPITRVKCQANHYPSHCMMRFPEVYSAEENWELGLKVALTKAAEEGGYSLRQTKNYKPAVLKKPMRPGIRWTAGNAHLVASAAGFIKTTK